MSEETANPAADAQHDVLEHYHLFDYRARCAVAKTTEITRELQKRHGLDPLTTIALGRAVGCVALLASTLKEADAYIHASWSTDQILRKVVAECDGRGHCRGYTSPHRIEEVLKPGEPVPESVGMAIGAEGLLTVTRGVYGQDPYRTVSALQNGEIASDIARYLTESEQIPSAVAAGVKLAADGSVLAAGAILVQKLGGAQLEESVIASVEHVMRHELHLSDRLAAGESSESLIDLICQGDKNYGRLLVRPLLCKCSCSRERMAEALFALGEEELQQIKEDTGRLEVRCQYCADTHNFRLEELLRH